MKLTVIPSDRKIIIDGNALEFDFPYDHDIHALHWYKDKGTIELINGKGSIDINNIQDVQLYIEAFEAEQERLRQLKLTSADEDLKNQALILLDKSDKVAIRCIKAGTSFPSEWMKYVEDLRAVVKGESATLPNMPKYPKES